MPDSEPDAKEAPASAEWRKATTWYRRPPGVVWLIGVVLIPLLLGVIGYSITHRSGPEAGEPSGPLPTLTEAPEVPPAPPPGLALAPLSIVRNGDEITLDGDVPSEEARRALLDAVVTTVGEDGVNVIDNLNINPNIKALDFSSARTVFAAAKGIPDLALVVNGDTVTLTGTAAAQADQTAVEDAAVHAWPHVNIVDNIEER